MTRTNEFILASKKMPDPVEMAQYADTHYHWISMSRILPEEVLAIRKVGYTPTTVDVLVYNASYGTIEIDRRIRERGEWKWAKDNGTLTHWGLLPLTPDDIADKERIQQRISANNSL